MHTAKSANKNQVDYVVRRKFFWNRTFSFIENPTYPNKSPERIAHREKGFDRLTQLDNYKTLLQRPSLLSYIPRFVFNKDYLFLYFFSLKTRKERKKMKCAAIDCCCWLGEIRIQYCYWFRPFDVSCCLKRRDKTAQHLAFNFLRRLPPFEAFSSDRRSRTSWRQLLLLWPSDLLSLCVALRCDGFAQQGKLEP